MWRRICNIFRESKTVLSINEVKPNDKKFIEVPDCLINQIINETVDIIRSSCIFLFPFLTDIF